MKYGQMWTIDAQNALMYLLQALKSDNQTKWRVASKLTQLIRDYKAALKTSPASQTRKMETK